MHNYVSDTSAQSFMNLKPQLPTSLKVALEVARVDILAEEYILSSNKMKPLNCCHAPTRIKYKL